MAEWGEVGIITMRNLILCLILLFITPSAYASYTIDKVNDWKYHSFICKNVVFHLFIISQLDRKNGVNEVSKYQDSFKTRIKNSIINDEKDYNFDLTDAEFIADLTFIIRDTLLQFNQNKVLETGVILNQGHNLCISTLDNMDKNF